MNKYISNSSLSLRTAPVARQAGFSLLELMTAMAVFLVIGGAGVQLFREHVPLFTAQQSQTAVNISARNAAAQIQMDLVNAGTGFYQGANVPTLPVGVSILPGTTFGTCSPGTTQNYTSACFDTVSIISIDTSASPLNATANESVETSTTFTGTVPTGSLFTAAQIAAQYKKGDEIIVVNGGTSNPGSRIAVAVLTANPTSSGSTVTFTHSLTATYADAITGQSYKDDYYNLFNTISNNSASTGPSGTNLDANANGYTFQTTDWILKIQGVTYGVSLANPADPTLERSSDNGAPQFVADQVIGFRVGGYGVPNGGGTAQFYYDTTTYDLNSITAVRISLIGRTNPQTDSQAEYHNSFDGGPYRVEGVSIVVDPRNLSM